MAEIVLILPLIGPSELDATSSFFLTSTSDSHSHTHIHKHMYVFTHRQALSHFLSLTYKQTNTQTRTHTRMYIHTCIQTHRQALTQAHTHILAYALNVSIITCCLFKSVNNQCRIYMTISLDLN